MDEQVTHLDSLGRQLKVGDVCVWFCVVGHAMDSSPTIVRELKENGNVVVDRLPDWWRPQKKLYRTTLKVPSYLTIVQMTEEEVKAKYGVE